jgi:RNA polymerase sigma-70 factor (ECF subfamily)
VDESRLKQQIRRAARGEEEAAAELFDHYYPRVYRYALAKLGTEQDAQDVASEAFAKVLRELDRFRWKGAGFEAWLFRIASNLVVDQYRHSGREVARQDVSEMNQETETMTPETVFAQRELRGELDRVLAELSSDQREVLLLRFAGGLDTQEVGKVMGRNANAVRQLQFRALDALRARMTDAGSI